MKIAVFSSKPYDIDYLKQYNTAKYELVFYAERLGAQTVNLAQNFEAICIFVNDVANAEVLQGLHKIGVKLILLRAAGFNNVDLLVAKELGIKVYRVPSYSPNSVAEHAVGLVLTLNRKIHRAYNRVKEQNFSLDGFLGFDLKGKTIGVLGTGQIGAIFAKIMNGFGCKLLGYDVFQNESLVKDLGLKYVSLDELLAQSDIISLHAPLLPTTHHIINPETIQKMKDGVMIINTSRGALIDTKSVIQGLKQGKIGYLGMDVYEEEADLFFEDLSNQIIKDDVFTRLLTFPNVIVTGHQAYFTKEAQVAIASSTFGNVKDFLEGKDANELTKTVEKKEVTKKEDTQKHNAVAVSKKAWAMLRAVGFLMPKSHDSSPAEEKK